MRPVSPAERADLARGRELLGIGPGNLAGLQGARTREQAAAVLAAFQAEIKRRWRDLAIQLHPDHGGSADDFRCAKKAADWAAGLRIQPVRPRPMRVYVVQTVVVTFNGGTGSAATNTTVW